MKKQYLLLLVIVVLSACSSLQTYQTNLEFHDVLDGEIPIYFVQKNKKINIYFNSQKATSLRIQIQDKEIKPNETKEIVFQEKGTYKVWMTYQAICKPNAKSCPTFEVKISEVKVE